MAEATIGKADSNFKIDTAKYFIGTQNRIIHSYDIISDKIIWTIIFRKLPELKIKVKELLTEI